MDTVSASETVSLELEDIQSGVLHPRPSPYVGTYVLLRIDDRVAGRELLRRLHRVLAAMLGSRSPSRTRA
jgi:deferrochelatase/peroxidase EfeB